MSNRIYPRQALHPLTILVMVLLLQSCGGDRNVEPLPGRTMPVAYAEGDTLELDPYPPNLSEWMAYYSEQFPGFVNGQFRCSGGTLHMDSLRIAESPVPGPQFRPYLSFNPDSSAYIDFLSYNTDLAQDTPMKSLAQGTGDPDQEVVLGEPATGKRWQLMYNGPGSSVEAADWLGKDEFLLALVRTDEKKGDWTPEVYLFSRKDSTFTNFTWSRSISTDSLTRMGENYIDHWFRHRMVRTK